MMKFTLGLFAILAVIGLGQAHQFPDFGKGPLHEDLQDILDLVPMEDIIDIVVDYILYDQEVQDFIEELTNPKSTLIKDVIEGCQAIPEVSQFLNYLQKEGINVNHIVNMINKSLNIKKLVPSGFQVYSVKERTGGLRGLFKDIKKHIDYDVFMSIYVDKLKTSEAFGNFINQLKSDNFQQIVNKVCEIKAVQYIVSRLEASSVNVKIVGDILYIAFGINVPKSPSKTVVQELADFVKLIPMEKYLMTIIQYINEDEKVQNAVRFMFTTEFHNLLRTLEALKEHQTLVLYLEKAGLPVIQSIQELHHVIGMGEYVPPKVESFLKSLITPQKIGDGMQGMLKDLYDLLPLNEIDALYKEKMRTSKTFVEFIAMITSEEIKEIINDLISHKTYKEFITKTKEKGWDMEGLSNLNVRIIGLKIKYFEANIEPKYNQY
ncbi:uncharacterized protein LOC105201870 [Solenopsis invicta]|uniref:uncharacterized protein LOC105201870 n=1 Tax=Solenopsis invicta TaxID=13686 RepID=UPI00193CCF7C|nr:uncharacterized protein LOC105201870 [Solenopsis invicta]